MIPQTGDIVRVRSRQYMVEGVDLPPHPTDSTLVRLSCLEEFLVANRIPFAIDAQRVSEPGDFMDSGHAMHLPFVSVMTADKRTVEWLQASKNKTIAQHAARIYRGGNVDNFKAALQALNSSPVFGTRAS